VKYDPASKRSQHRSVREEWDFYNCPQEELKTCCHYEYARESRPICEMVALLRKNGKSIQRLIDAGAKVTGDFARNPVMRLSKIEDVLRGLYLWLPAWCIDFCVAFEHFPNTPWLCLPAAQFVCL
jgi:hypothetical protein